MSALADRSVATLAIVAAAQRISSNLLTRRLPFGPDSERTHVLQRQIRRAGSRSRRGRRPEELGAQSGALALLTNLVMAWNTHQMQVILDGWRGTDRRKVDAEILSHLTPMGFEHINCEGVLAFPLGAHRARILPSSSPPEAPERGVG